MQIDGSYPGARPGTRGNRVEDPPGHLAQATAAGWAGGAGPEAWGFKTGTQENGALPDEAGNGGGGGWSGGRPEQWGFQTGTEKKR